MIAPLSDPTPLHTVEASAAQIDLRTMRVRKVGTGQVATAERDVVEPRAAEISTREYRRLEPEARELRDAEVGVVEPAVVERGGAERRLTELERRRTGSRRSEPGGTPPPRSRNPRGRNARAPTSTSRARANASPACARADDPHADELAVVVEIEAIARIHRAILTPRCSDPAHPEPSRPLDS